MITTNGKNYIKRFLALQVPTIASSVAFGIGPAAESVSHTNLHFEVARADIDLTSYDFVNNKLVFKAELPENFSGKVYEVALYSLPANTAAGQFDSKILTTFDSATELWVDAGTGTGATFNATFARIGADALRHTPAASTTKTDTMQSIAMDLSGYSAADQFSLAFNAGNAFTSTVKVRFMTDAANYYEVNFGTPGAGYNIVLINKGAAVATGVPDWSNITEMRVLTTSTAGGASQVDYDGLRIEDTDTLNTDYVMVSRELLAAPYTVVEGMTQEVEFSLDVSV